MVPSAQDGPNIAHFLWPSLLLQKVDDSSQQIVSRQKTPIPLLLLRAENPSSRPRLVAPPLAAVVLTEKSRSCHFLPFRKSALCKGSVAPSVLMRPNDGLTVRALAGALYLEVQLWKERSVISLVSRAREREARWGLRQTDGQSMTKPCQVGLQLVYWGSMNGTGLAWPPRPMSFRLMSCQYEASHRR